MGEGWCAAASRRRRRAGDNGRSSRTRRSNHSGTPPRGRAQATGSSGGSCAGGRRRWLTAAWPARAGWDHHQATAATPTLTHGTEDVGAALALVTWGSAHRSHRHCGACAAHSASWHAQAQPADRTPTRSHIARSCKARARAQTPAREARSQHQRHLANRRRLPATAAATGCPWPRRQAWSKRAECVGNGVSAAADR